MPDSGVVRQTRYRATPGGRAADARYEDTPKARARKARYDASPRRRHTRSIRGADAKIAKYTDQLSRTKEVA